jgi:hypothetical protein
MAGIDSVGIAEAACRHMSPSIANIILAMVKDNVIEAADIADPAIIGKLEASAPAAVTKNQDLAWVLHEFR